MSIDLDKARIWEAVISGLVLAILLRYALPAAERALSDGES